MTGRLYRMRKLNRRDRCWLVGRRAARLSEDGAVTAWGILSAYLEHTLSERDVPKFNDLIGVIRTATIEGAKSNENRS